MVFSPPPVHKVHKSERKKVDLLLGDFDWSRPKKTGGYSVAAMKNATNSFS
jgi:hypothetical protein